MLEKIGNLAEDVAANVGVSRRNFLDWAGRGALALAGVLAVGRIAKAGPATAKPCCHPGGGCPIGYFCRSFPGGGAGAYSRRRAPSRHRPPLRRWGRPADHALTQPGG
jgi:hypothetical protein